HPAPGILRRSASCIPAVVSPEGRGGWTCGFSSPYQAQPRTRITDLAQTAPSPPWGEGWGEGTMHRRTPNPRPLSLTLSREGRGDGDDAARDPVPTARHLVPGIRRAPLPSLTQHSPLSLTLSHEGRGDGDDAAHDPVPTAPRPAPTPAVQEGMAPMLPAIPSPPLATYRRASGGLLCQAPHSTAPCP